MSSGHRCAATLCVVAVLAYAALGGAGANAQSMPRIVHEHGASQILVDGKPFLMRGGELENSSASSLDFLSSIWPEVAAMHFNTVLAPAYWQLIEPREGQFDFTTVDGLILGARVHHMKLVLLWFGSWKNSMSCYAPSWVKRDEARFPRVQTLDGTHLEILSAFSPNVLKADSTAFTALMKHLREHDSADHTVILIQVENEVGMIPEARDHSEAADAAFRAPVPAALTNYLSSHRDILDADLRKAWEAHGSKSGASWPETFGDGPATDELFTAWTEGRFTGQVAAEGKAVNPLPMYVNAALVRPGKLPGQYPSGGPLPHLFDIWRAAAPSIDFLAPDLYFPNFVNWSRQYVRDGNALFIPETGRADAANMAANGLYAYGQLNTIGFSVYAPEFLSADEQRSLGEAYDLVDQLTPTILASQGTGRMAAVRTPSAFDGSTDLSDQQLSLGTYTFHVHFRNQPPMSVGAKADADGNGAHGGLIIQLGDQDFLVAGTGMTITFGVQDRLHAHAGIDSIWEGRFVHGVWTPGRNLNGDDDNQGRSLNLPSGKFTLRRVRLYEYR